MGGRQDSQGVVDSKPLVDNVVREFVFESGVSLGLAAAGEDLRSVKVPFRLVQYPFPGALGCGFRKECGVEYGPIGKCVWVRQTVESCAVDVLCTPAGGAPIP